MKKTKEYCKCGHPKESHYIMRKNNKRIFKACKRKKCKCQHYKRQMSTLNNFRGFSGH